MKSREHEKEFLRILEEVYKSNYNLLYNYGLKFMANPVLIQDFIQEIFIRLCKRSTLQDISDIKVYLLRAMRNMVYDHHATAYENVSVDEMEFMLPEDTEAFESFFFSRDDEEVKQYRLLLKHINALPPQQKQILYLFYVKGLSHKEIAEILDINPQSSMNSLYKSVQRLRAIFKDSSLSKYRQEALLMVAFLSVLFP